MVSCHWTPHWSNSRERGSPAMCKPWNSSSRWPLPRALFTGVRMRSPRLAKGKIQGLRYPKRILPGFWYLCCPGTQTAGALRRSAFWAAPVRCDGELGGRGRRKAQTLGGWALAQALLCSGLTVPAACCCGTTVNTPVFFPRPPLHLHLWRKRCTRSSAWH